MTVTGSSAITESGTPEREPSTVRDEGDLGGFPRLRVRETIEETHDARSIVLEVPASQAHVFAYRPGQFLTIRIPGEASESVARSYSLSSAPGEEHLKVTVKRTVGGYGSNWLCDNVSAGDWLTVLPPSGRFTPRSLDGEMILFAAGSGITPIMSIVKSAMADGTARAVLFYAFRTASDVIFDEELRELERTHTQRLRILRWCDEQRGIPGHDDIAGATTGLVDADAYLCGPGPFMDLVARSLAGAGFERTRVFREVFASLSGDPFASRYAPAEPASTGGDDGAASAQVVVHIDGDSHEVAWPRAQTLVDVLLASGIDVPYSCRSGECGSCACTVVSGEVSMQRTDLLDDDDIADGYILGCQARPVSPSVEVRF